MLYTAGTVTDHAVCSWELNRSCCLQLEIVTVQKTIHSCGVLTFSLWVQTYVETGGLNSGLNNMATFLIWSNNHFIIQTSYFVPQQDDGAVLHSPSEKPAAETNPHLLLASVGPRQTEQRSQTIPVCWMQGQDRDFLFSECTDKVWLSVLSTWTRPDSPCSVNALTRSDSQCYLHG